MLGGGGCNSISRGTFFLWLPLRNERKFKIPKQNIFSFSRDFFSVNSLEEKKVICNLNYLICTYNMQKIQKPQITLPYWITNFLMAWAFF